MGARLYYWSVICFQDVFKERFGAQHLYLPMAFTIDFSRRYSVFLVSSPVITWESLTIPSGSAPRFSYLNFFCHWNVSRLLSWRCWHTNGTKGAITSSKVPSDQFQFPDRLITRVWAPKERPLPLRHCYSTKKNPGKCSLRRIRTTSDMHFQWMISVLWAVKESIHRVG